MGSLACGELGHNERTIGDIECLTVFSSSSCPDSDVKTKKFASIFLDLRCKIASALSTPSNSRRLPMYPITGLPLNSSFILGYSSCSFFKIRIYRIWNNDNFVWFTPLAIASWRRVSLMQITESAFLNSSFPVPKSLVPSPPVFHRPLATADSSHIPRIS